jgi:glucose-6-phosphate dehydrogenase assembly protein OpcA
MSLSAVIFPAQPEQILKGLGKLWTSLGQEEKQQGKPTVLRACAMTLIVATDEADNGLAASEIISELMKEHPSRGIVLAVSSQAERPLEARVLAQTWKPFGKAQQIGCEQIEITARPESWPNIGPTLVGLIAADLPAILWCRHYGALRKDASDGQIAGLEAVAQLAQKVILDTDGMDTNDAVGVIARWQKQSRVVADLQWTRLTQWREPISHIFDNEKRENCFDCFHTFEIEHAGEQTPLIAIYMGAWLSAPRKAKVVFRSTDAVKAGIGRIVMISDKETITFTRDGSNCATLRSTNGRERKYNFRKATLTALLTEELSLVNADPAFDIAWARVAELMKP